MIDPETCRRAIAPDDRRAFMAALARLAGGAAAARLLGVMAPAPAAALTVPEDDARLDAQYISETDGGRTIGGYLVRQGSGSARAPGVVLIHEDRGLTPHIRDIARRLALEGFVAFVPDLLGPLGGTPADERQARLLIARLDLVAAAENVMAATRWLARGRRTSGAVGIMGFCWGGAMVNRVAVAAGEGLRAGVAYCAPAPRPAEAPKVSAALLLHFAGLDERVNKSGAAWVAALQKTGKAVTAYYYPGAAHAFGNDASPELYDPVAARLAWDRTIAFLTQQLA